MATLRLQDFSGLKGGSVIGYTADGANDYKYTATAKTVAEGYSTLGNVASVTGGLGLNIASDKTVTELEATGSQAWSIVGSNNITRIETGDGKDTVELATTSADGVEITTGGSADVVSITTAKGKVTVDAGEGADLVSIKSAQDDVTVRLGEGADSLGLGGVNGDVVITGSGTAANMVMLSDSISGTVNIELGDGNDFLGVDSIISGTISLGDGQNTIDSTNPKAKGTYAAGFQNATITSGKGSDEIWGMSLISSTINTGDGKDSVEFAYVTDSTINMGDGADHLEIGRIDKASTSILSGTTINMGAGKDTVKIDVATKDTLVDLGEGDDSIVLRDDFEGEISIAGGEGKDTINVSDIKSGTVTLTDFDINNDILITEKSGGYEWEVTDLHSDGTLTFSDPKSSDKKVVKVNETNGFYAIRDTNDIVAWAGENGALIDASSLNTKVGLVGNDNEDAVDTLIGGSKDDSIIAGQGDYVYGGAGNDQITLTGTSKGGAHVGLTSKGGKDIVTGFQKVTDSAEADTIYLFENNISDLKLTNVSGNIQAKLGTATMTLDKVVVDSTIKIEDQTGTSYKVAYTNAGSASEAEGMANIYYAASKSATLDFSSFNDNLVVDLGNSGVAGSNTGDAIYYGGFASVKGGQDNTILVGAANTAETLAAGSGDTTLWGGGHKADVLQGTSKTDDGVVTFVYGAGDGKDTIQNAAWGGEDTSDVLWLNNADIKSVKNDGTNTSVTLNSTGDKLTLEKFGSSQSDTVLKVTTDGRSVTQVKVGVSSKSNTWTYNENVAAYMGGSNNTLQVKSDVDTANIWLDGSQGVSYDNVKTVDASSNSGTLIIAGNGSANESLVAGKGETSMWGGSGESNDTLKGAANGTTTFFFGNGDGKDVITNSYSDDKVCLYNVALSDIADLDTSKSGIMKITLNDGSSLTINSMSSSSVHTFQLGDGSTWSYNYSKKTWSEA